MAHHIPAAGAAALVSEQSINVLVSSSSVPQVRQSRRGCCAPLLPLALLQRLLGRVLGRGPAGQQTQRVPGGGTGLGGIDEQRQAGVGGEIQALVHEVEVPDHGMPEMLEPGVVLAHVVGRPPRTELLTARGKFPDKVGQAPVEGVPAGLRPQDRHRVIRGALPVRVERIGAAIEENEPGVVGRPDRAGVHLGIQRVAKLVRGEDVQAPVAHEGRGAGHCVEHQLDARTDRLGGGAAALRLAGAAGGPGQVEQVRLLRLIQLQCPGQGLQDSLGDAGEVSAFQPGVILDTDPGEHGDLAAAQSGDAAVAAVDGQTRLFRRDFRPPGGQEVPRLALVVHAFNGKGCGAVRESLPVPLTAGPPSPRPSGV